MQKSIANSFAGHLETTADAEAELVREAQFNHSAFATIYELHHATIYRYLFTCTGNSEDAADLTQQVFLKALTSLRTYNSSKGALITWLFAIAHNCALNFVKRRKIASSAAWDISQQALVDAIPASDPEAEILRQEASAKLHTLLARLDYRKRELLALRFVSGLTTAQIATIVGKSQAGVKKQITRLLQDLRKEYHADIQ